MGEEENVKQPQNSNTGLYRQNIPTTINAKLEKETIACQHKGSQGVTWAAYYYYFSATIKTTP